MSQTPYELSAAARLDLLDIWNYLADTTSLEVADEIAEDIENAITALVKYPQRGHPRSDLTTRKVLFYRVHAYLVIFRRDTNPLHILRILHAARDVKHLLEG